MENKSVVVEQDELANLRFISFAIKKQKKIIW
jgi:hypothetical protein